MMNKKEELGLIKEITKMSSSFLDDANMWGGEKIPSLLKKTVRIKESLLECYRDREMTYECFCTCKKIVENTQDSLSYIAWFNIK